MLVCYIIFLSIGECVLLLCLGLVFSISSQEIGLRKRLRNDLFCVNWVVKPQLNHGWLGEMSLKCPILCLVGRKTTTQSHVERCECLLFCWAGVSNSLLMFCAALSDHKVLLHSDSFSRLTDTCHALSALMYPLKYRSACAHICIVCFSWYY